MFKRLPILILLPLALAATACGGGDDPSTGGEASVPTTAPPTTTPPTTTPPTTTPPTTTPPTTAPPTTAPPTNGDLPAEYVEIDDGAFDSIGDMADSADVIVVATVTGDQAIPPGRTDVSPLPQSYLGIRLSVDEVLKGEPGDEIRLAWHAYTLDDDGNRIANNVLNGIPVPHEGDQLVLFLRAADSGFADVLDGFPTHTPVMLDGIGFVRDGAVAITDSVVPEIAVLTGLSLDEIRAAV